MSYYYNIVLVRSLARDKYLKVKSFLVTDEQAHTFYNCLSILMITIVTIAGPLQLQFLSGTLKRPIYPHYELYQDVSEYPFYPCSCIDLEEDSRDEIHVMWVAMEEGRNLNHIIPLLPRRENRGTNWLINYRGSIRPWLYI